MSLWHRVFGVSRIDVWTVQEFDETKLLLKALNEPPHPKRIRFKDEESRDAYNAAAEKYNREVTLKSLHPEYPYAHNVYRRIPTL